MSVPEFSWKRLREESPGAYESYVDLESGAWTNIKIVVTSTKARLYVNGASQPCLVVNDLKLGEAKGRICTVGPQHDRRLFFRAESERWALGGHLPAGPARQAISAEMADVKGGKDHPLVSRYAGSVMLGYRQQFDELVIPLADPVKATISTWKLAKEVRVEGAATRLLYLIPEGRSPLEVVRNYEGELGRAGFQSLYTCAGDKCTTILTQFLYPGGQRLKYGNGMSDLAEMAFSVIADARYLVLKRVRPDGEAYVSLFVGVNNLHIPAELNMRTIALLDVVVKAGMDTGMVTVDAASMAREMGKSGHVALYGILFDTGKAAVKPASEPALVEIAKLLKQDPALKLYVVGHTDNVGAFEQNMTLSDRRAAAVVQELTLRHGVAAPRLRAVGVGPAAPVAPNDKEEGRAKNRRVELVAQ